MANDLQLSYNKTGAIVIAKAHYDDSGILTQRVATVELTEVFTGKYAGTSDVSWQAGDVIDYYEDTIILESETFEPYNDLALEASVQNIKTETDKLSDTLEDNGGTYRFTTAALVNAPTAEMDATELAEAMKAITGITVGGTWTWGKIMKVFSAISAGNWRKKVGYSGVQQLLDAEDGDTVILEQSLTSSPTAGSNYRTITVLI